MSKLALDKFLALVQRSSLVDVDRLANAANDWKRHATLSQLDDARYCADRLVDVGLLTRWQAKKLLEGRHRGFFLGKYKLLDHLGSGGMSNVYLAQHTLMQRLVAIKVLPQHRVSDRSYLARFHLEGQCIAALDHPNIVTAYDLDSEAKIHYLVMEYIDGSDLQAIVTRYGPADFHTAADYVAQSALGLSHAHESGLVHRDIKPANLLVDAHGVVKILDMGLAKFAAQPAPADLADDAHILGTADYVAPEQTVDSSTVDHRADIYSLGCTLYFLLTGHPPFASGAPLERMVAHQRQAPPSILLDRPDAPEPLVRICARMMEKSPLKRYSSAAEVHTALTAWLAGEATAGRVRWHAEAMVGHAGPAGMPTDHLGSRPNRAIGSDAESSNAAQKTPSVSSPFSDTDSNLQHATEKLPRNLVGTGGDASQSGSSHSHVLHRDLLRYGGTKVSELAQSPSPIDIPPAPASAEPVHALHPPPSLTAPAVAPDAIAPVEMPVVSPSKRTFGRTSRRRSGLPWLGIVLLSGLILAAALLAVFSMID